MKKIFLFLIMLMVPTLGIVFFVSNFMVDDNLNTDDVICESKIMNVSAYNFRNNHFIALSLCKETVTKEDEHIVKVAIGVLESLREEVQYLLVKENELLHKLLKVIYSLNQNVDNPVVTFINYNEEIIDYFIIVNGERINRPEDPIKERHNFIGWLVEGYDYLFNFDNPITRNINLHALFIIDYRVVNETTVNSMAANIHIQRTTTYNNESFVETFSGVIFNAYLHPQGTGIRFHVLTTYDVIRVPENHDKELVLHDFRQHYSNGRHNNPMIYHVCEESNLAVLRFWVGGGNLNNLPRNLNVIRRAETNPSMHDPIIMMGQLHSDQRNSITLGRISNFSSMKNYLGEEITFMSHTALSTYVSNGSAILNMNQELVGIQFHTIGNCINSFEKSLAIPIEIINAFLDTRENAMW